jgi:hypothetical protein
MAIFGSWLRVRSQPSEAWRPLFFFHSVYSRASHPAADDSRHLPHRAVPPAVTATASREAIPVEYPRPCCLAAAYSPACQAGPSTVLRQNVSESPSSWLHTYDSMAAGATWQLGSPEMLASGCVRMLDAYWLRGAGPSKPYQVWPIKCLPLAERFVPTSTNPYSLRLFLCSSLSCCRLLLVLLSPTARTHPPWLPA